MILFTNTLNLELDIFISILVICCSVAVVGLTFVFES